MLLLGARRGVARIGKTLASNCTYLKADLKDITPTYTEIALSDVSGMPTYFLGLFTANVPMPGWEPFRATLVRQTPPGCVIGVHWGPGA